MYLENLPCRHRGGTLGFRTAQSCNQISTQVEVYSCRLHGECTLAQSQLRKANTSFIQVCSSCMDRSPKLAGEPDRVDEIVVSPVIQSPVQPVPAQPAQPVQMAQPVPVQPTFNLKPEPVSSVKPFSAQPLQPTPGYIATPDGKYGRPCSMPPMPQRPPTKKLTIGMAFYERPTEVIFTVQALRMMHPEIMENAEILLVDNKPDSEHGKMVEGWLQTWIPNGRYIPFPSPVGTSAPREHIFREAAGEYVLCMDAHVFILPGALAKLIQVLDSAVPRGIFHGPLLGDNLQVQATHFDNIWQAEMYGVWGNDPRGQRFDQQPFEIPSSGLGMFACRRDEWVSFPDHLSHFGGEEGMVHEKFRQEGGKAYCLPFLGWWHYFGRPYGVPYPLTREGKMRNYLIWHRHLGLDPSDMLDHFGPIAGPEKLSALINEVKLLP